MLSQFFVLSPRGDTIVIRDFRRDGVRGLAEIFFRRVRANGHAAPPVIVVDDVCFIYLKRSGLYFALTTSKLNAPLAHWIDLLEAVVRVVKDFCGVLSEDTIRKNFALVYEIVDEMFDFGYPQATKTSELTSIIKNELHDPSLPATGSLSAASAALQPYAAALSSSLGTLSSAGLSQISGGIKRPENLPRTVPSTASQTPIVGSVGPGQLAPDIFIDILDRVSAEISCTDGSVRWMTVDGLIVVKSYLTEQTQLSLGLNEELQIGNPFLQTGSAAVRPSYKSSGVVCIEDCLFHECVSLDAFNSDRSLLFSPPQGEFNLMRYRLKTSPAPEPPLTCVAHLTVLSKDKVSH